MLKNWSFIYILCCLATISSHLLLLERRLQILLPEMPPPGIARIPHQLDEDIGVAPRPQLLFGLCLHLVLQHWEDKHWNLFLLRTIIQSLDFWNYRTWSGLAKCPNCRHFFLSSEKKSMVLVLVLLNTAQTLPVGYYTAQSVWTVRLFPLDFKVSIFDQLLYINFIKFVFEMHLYLKCCAGLVVIGSTPGLF